MNTIYAIPTDNLTELLKRLERVNKRAAKNNLPRITLVASEPYAARLDTDLKLRSEADDDDADWLPDDIEYTYEAVDVTISHDVVRVDGWTFVATLDHSSVPGATIVRNVPNTDVELPASFREADPRVCEHCNTKRHRKDTFVIHRDGEFKQIGRNCLADFIGHDVAALVRWLEHVRMYAADIEREYSEPTTREPISAPVHKIVEATMLVVDKFGWTSRSAARDNDDLMPTANDVETYVFGFGRAAKRLHELLGKPTDEQRQRAADAIEWIKSTDPDNDYLHNLRTIVDADVCTYRNVGILASIYVAHAKAVENEVKRSERLAAINNEHFGSVDARYTFDLTVVATRVFDGYYGTTHFYSFRDADNHSIVYFSSRPLRTSDDLTIQPGDNVSIKATIKKHDYYNDVAQTVITRGNIVNS